MPLPGSLEIPGEQGEQLREAAGFSCECCGETLPSHLLEIHFIGTGTHRLENIARDLQKYILVLCPLCHREIHDYAISWESQRDLTRMRPRKTQQVMRVILGYTPRHYEPPGEADIGEIYEECFRVGGLGMYRAGG